MYDDLYISVKMSFKIMITNLINRRGVTIRRVIAESVYFADTQNKLI